MALRTTTARTPAPSVSRRRALKAAHGIAPDQGHRRQEEGNALHLAQGIVPAVGHQGDEAQANRQVLEVDESQQAGAGQPIRPVLVLRRHVQQDGSAESR